MAISVQWDNPERTIIRWDFEQKWSWEELADSARVTGAMVASTEEDVDVILNAVGSHPPLGKLSPYQRSAFAYVPSNIRLLMLVCEEGYEALQIVLPFFQQLEVADSLEQARVALQLQPA